MRTTTQLPLVILLGLSILTSIGCSSVREPRFETMGVREVERTESRTVYAFIVKATNPNKESIPLREVSYSVTLDNTHKFSGVRSPETTLHTYGEHIFELPAVFEIAQGDLTGIVDYKLNGSVKYLRPGKLSETMFESELIVPKAEFRLRGQVNVDSPNGE